MAPPDRLSLAPGAVQAVGRLWLQPHTNASLADCVAIVPIHLHPTEDDALSCAQDLANVMEGWARG